VAAYFLRHLHPLLSGGIAGIIYLVILIGIDRDFQRIGGYVLRQATGRVKLKVLR
jgi:hypothetical protein